MNKYLLILMTGACITTSASVFAADDPASTGMQKNMKSMDMKMIDTNGDNMISKDEFMKYQEMQFGKMKKTKDGMVDMKDMQMMGMGTGMPGNEIHGDKDKMNTK